MTPYYEREGIQLWHADCMDVLPTLERVDLVLTDPPYGIGAGREKPHNGWRDYGVAEWDLARLDCVSLTALLRAGREQIIWGGNYFADMLPASMGWLIWDKGQRGFSLADCELAWTSRNRAARIFDHSRAAALMDGKEHPTQKPIALMQWCLDLFPDAELILDPFAGSGTTGVAAFNLGRKAILIEREEKYCEVAAKRLESLTPPLFTLPAEKPVQASWDTVGGFEWMHTVGHGDLEEPA